MARRSGFPGRTLIQRGPKRQVVWGVGPNAQNVSSMASFAAVWSNGVVLTQESEVTIVRLRGDLLLTLLAQTAIGDGFAGAVGIGIVNSQAFATGIGAMPTPVTEVDWPGWMWHSFFNLRGITALEADGSNAMGVVQRMLIDSKAMRKMGDEEVLFGAIEGTLSGGGTLELQADSRLLAKLH